ncbi:MAG: hypothetical protein HUU35_18055, partial [Armatimonadetes bacterium]|nr:hypothetical protein [Armatimonadota bacterium]
GCLAIVALNVAVRFSELKTGRYIAGGVPPVSAFALLLLLLAARALLSRLGPRLALSRRQILLAYTMLCFGSPLAGCYFVRAWLPHLVALRYWEPKKPELTGLSEYLPGWAGPRGEDAVRFYYEGIHTAGAVPWAEWLRPLLMWSIFIAAVAIGMYCLMALVQKQWIRGERLTFPILYLPLTLTDNASAGPASDLWRRHLFWIGVGVTAVFNGLNIAHTVVPSLPAPGFSYPLAPLFSGRNWAPFTSVRLFFMLETIGFGYFIPLEVSFTVWFAYLAIKLFAVAGVASGYERPGFPFIHEQCAGAYVAVALFLLYGLRHHLADLWRRAWRAGETTDSERVAWLGLLLSLLVMLWFMTFAGVPFIIAGAFLAVLLLFVLVYARIRGETGAPLEFTYPYWMIKNLVSWSFTPTGIAAMGGLRAPVAFGLFSWLSRHHFAKGLAAYDLDSFKLAETVAIPRRVLAVTVGLAIAVGFAAATWAHLDAYYDLGTNLASGSLGGGEYRATVALEEFMRSATDLAMPKPRPWDRLAYVGVGFGLASIMALWRSLSPGFPLHPLGFILATAYGDHNTAIFPMFVAWAAKAGILRLGGLRAYRQGIPFFVGLIAGHFFFAGVFWPLLSLALGPETSRAYHLFFGG